MSDPTSDDQNLPSFAFAAGVVRAHHDPRIQRVALMLAKKGGVTPLLADLTWPKPVTADLRAAVGFLRARAKGSDTARMLERAASWLEHEAERLPAGA